MERTAWWGEPPGRVGTWPTAPQVLLLQAAILTDDRGRAAWERLRPILDLEQVCGAAQAILPALHRNLVALGVDDPILPALRGIRRHAWVQNQRVLHTLVPVVGRLEEQGIPTVLLKGGALLAAGVDAVLRPLSDLDVLVPPTRQVDAVQALGDAGFTPEGAPPWYVVRCAPTFTPGFPFSHPDGRTLDLHWNALHISRRVHADDALWDHVRPVTVLGVETQVPAAADLLMHAIAHGLRWNTMPTYRWVLDASMILRGDVGPVDGARLVADARARDLGVVLEAGLSFLADTVGTAVPRELRDALRAGRTSWIERAELSAQVRAPRVRTRHERVLLDWQRTSRAVGGVGARSTPLRWAGLVARRAGVATAGDLRRLATRRRALFPPQSGSNALIEGPVGSPPPLRLPAAVSFDRVHEPERYVVHGTWLPERSGTWTAGRAARLRFPLAASPRGSLVVRMRGAAHLAGTHRRQPVAVVVGGRTVARWVLDPERPTVDHEQILVPASLVRGAAAIDLVLRTPGARSPAELGVSDDDRRLGIFVEAMDVRAVAALAPGTVVDLATGDDRYLAGGWSYAEPDGRWSVGPTARLVFACTDPQPPLDLCLAVDGFGDVVAQGVEIRCTTPSGRSAVRMPSVASPDGWVRVPLGAVPAGEVTVTIAVGRPVSPAALGYSDDTRPLGICLRRFAVVPAGGRVS